MAFLKLIEYKELLEGYGLLESCRLCGAEETFVRGLTYESGKTQKDTLFVCKGAAFRKEYLEDAISRGACCYVSETDYGIPDVPCILVRSIREAMPHLARAFYAHPEDGLFLTGITGTKGKTTTVFMIRGIVDAYAKHTGGKEMAYLSSVETYDGKVREPSKLTTPEAMEVYRRFRAAADSGIRYLSMEVSSQALKYGRVRGIRYDIGLFLNISEDHISPIEHPDFEDYFHSKLSLFRQTKTACINLDADRADEIRAAAAGCEKIVTFGSSPEADLYFGNVRSGPDGIGFTVFFGQSAEEFHLRMHGLFNVENAMAAIACAYCMGIPVSFMKEGIASVTVPGRVETYTGRGGKLKVIVDYAHNGVSFRKIMGSAASEFGGWRMETVFGCTGVKAVNRRRGMAEAASDFCVKAYLTADDPATEPVEEICADIRRYMDEEKCPCTVIPDRETAIRTAIEQAQDNTVLLVLGKGAETAQKVGSGSVPYESDAVIVKRYIK